MIRAGALTDEVTIFTEGGPESGTSIFGDPEHNEDSGVTVPAAVSPLDATEIEINRDVRLNRYSVMLEADVPISGISEIEWQGERYRAIGEPKKFSSVRGAHHLELEIRRAEG